MWSDAPHGHPSPVLAEFDEEVEATVEDDVLVPTLVVIDVLDDDDTEMVGHVNEDSTHPSPAPASRGALDAVEVVDVEPEPVASLDELLDTACSSADGSPSIGPADAPPHATTVTPSPTTASQRIVTPTP